MIKAITSIFIVKPDELQPLNGIRAIAILFVLLFHYNMGVKQVGNYRDINPIVNNVIDNIDWGVDLFFILSGFLISFELFASWQKRKKVGVKIFYIKRVFRIFPAYYFFIIISSLFFMLQLSAFQSAPPGSVNPDKIIMIEKMLRGAIIHFLFLGNIFAEGTSYLWALATEIQFYLLFPPVAYFLLFKQKPRTRMISLVCAFFIIMGLRLSCLFFNNFDVADHTVSFSWISIRFRFDSIVIGIILMELYFNHKQIIGAMKSYHKSLILMSGITLVVASHIMKMLTDSQAADVIKYNLFSAGCGMIILAILAGNSMLSRFLSLRVFTPISRVSYTMYLWHAFTPMISIAFTGVIHRQMNSFIYSGVYLLYAAVTFLFCCILHLVIEYPFMELKNKIIRHGTRMNEGSIV